MALNVYSIVFHGNCIDGWLSAYIARTALINNGMVNMYAISPNQKSTWPALPLLAKTHILLLDVSVPKNTRDEWFAAGAYSIYCIDHHESAKAHWKPRECPINTAYCAALQTWIYFYPQLAIPDWLSLVDRIDRWDNPTYEDRCIREVLNQIAHLPVKKAFDDAINLTDVFIHNYNLPGGKEAAIAQGKIILDQKDLSLLGLLNRGTFLQFNQDLIQMWALPQTWLGANAFIINTTDIVLDSTEAAHLVFTHYPATQIFINYRSKSVHVGGVSKTMYVYSARSRAFNLTEGTILKGHHTAAGASLIKEDAPVLPFIIAA
jgi:hypothetical protein